MGNKFSKRFSVCFCYALLFQIQSCSLSKIPFYWPKRLYRLPNNANAIHKCYHATEENLFKSLIKNLALTFIVNIFSGFSNKFIFIITRWKKYFHQHLLWTSLMCTACLKLDKTVLQHFSLTDLCWQWHHTMPFFGDKNANMVRIKYITGKIFLSTDH